MPSLQPVLPSLLLPVIRSLPDRAIHLGESFVGRLQDQRMVQNRKADRSRCFLGMVGKPQIRQRPGNLFERLTVVIGFLPDVIHAGAFHTRECTIPADSYQPERECFPGYGWRGWNNCCGNDKAMFAGCI